MHSLFAGDALPPDDLLTTALIMLAAVLLDAWLGEPPLCWHPLVAFGRLAAWAEQRFHGRWGQGALAQISAGAMAWLLLLLPGVVLAWLLSGVPLLGELGAVLGLYWALGHRSLHDHAQPVFRALQQGEETTARDYAARIVSRDAATLDIEKSTIESILENGNDAIFGALFWFALAGLPGVVLFRLANTLDASWGYRSPRYLYFGRASARIDDALNWLPARLTALSYALLGQTRVALRCWRAQAGACDSPNGGPVMAAGAGALGIRLGGPARYRGEWLQKPWLGQGPEPVAADIPRALTLVRRSLVLWVLVLLAAGLLNALR
ncbi:adenosylcobinamide-phosphate synthase CbiB [Marinobacterium sedimentorum]|uniref:adenosylcobinamide-phosphate synthase CbiB n=1 Tax=Marinobacterium sedimentorum TaxID=2927804 RepID=UPI0020C6D530|nr:adenosylcobinamide-phosphate synthase CbiB [Marinobacterium sedimentorum]MCP8686505.1 adenosylcobinamide-phosphate synthase CbiB [Marinobacterium sedimentorum]